MKFVICQLLNSGEEPASVPQSGTLGVLEASSSAPRGWLCLISSWGWGFACCPKEKQPEEEGGVHLHYS